MAMSYMWLLLTVTVTCMCASPRCRSSAASLSFSAYCQKLCAWGRGGNLCHCNAAHFVGKRREIRQQELGDSAVHKPLIGQNLGSDDDEVWDDDNDADALRVPGDWFDDKNSTSEDDVWPDQSDDPGSSTLFRGHSRRRRQPMIFLALQGLGWRHRAAKNADQLLRDSAKKGEHHEPVLFDHVGRPGSMTLNPLTRKPTILRLSPQMNKWEVLRKMTSQSREFSRPVAAFIRFQTSIAHMQETYGQFFVGLEIYSTSISV